MPTDDLDPLFGRLLEGLLPMAGWALKESAGWLNERSISKHEHRPPWEHIKLIHANDLQHLDAFPRCQEFQGVSYGRYRTGARRLRRVRAWLVRFVDAQRKIDELDHQKIVQYDERRLELPRTLRRKTVRVALPIQPRPGTWAEAEEGTVMGDYLVFHTGWQAREIRVRYKGPSREVHRDALDEARRILAGMGPLQRKAWDELQTSVYAHPVLFISHRWESLEHPDPSGRQLEQLRNLRDCFLIYDYTSFPQMPRTEAEQENFTAILAAMSRLIRNVVVLDAPDYLARGWCLYEYVVASLRRTTVCDEVRDPMFVTLRDWASTRRARPLFFGGRATSVAEDTNEISKAVISAITNILPRYLKAEFLTDQDRQAVTALLISELKKVLPRKRVHQPYLGDWTSEDWTEEELAQIFERDTNPSGIPYRAKPPPSNSNVPRTIADAVVRNYSIEEMPQRYVL